jgi:hypothetical protein
VRIEDAGSQAINRASMQRDRFRYFQRFNERLGKHPGLILATVIAIYCGLAVGLALTRRPWCDEGWFAGIVYNLLHHGVMSLTVLDPHGFIFAPYVKGIDQYTYWVLPGHILAQVAWSSVVGLTPFTMRILSTAWGVLALVSWYAVLRHLCQSRLVGLVAVTILAFDRNFLLDAASGRMDMMCASLSLAASALYIRLRSKFERAIVAAASLLAVALLTHPNAVFGIILLAFIVVALDRDRLRWRTLMLAGIPFAVLIGVWLIYFFQAPDIAIAQFQAQAKIPHRFQVNLNPLRQIGDELRGRYGGGYHLRSPLLTVKATGAVLILYLAAIPAVLFFKSIRQRPGAKLIACFALASFALLSCLQDNAYYLVYTLPALSASLALCVTNLLQNRSLGSRLVLVGVAAGVLLNLTPTLFRISQNDYRNRFDAAIQFLKENTGPNDLVMGSAELSFGLGFDGRVLDDCRLGYATGRKPEFIVLEGQYYTYWFPWLAQNEPAVATHIDKLLKDEYTVIYDQNHDGLATIGTSTAPFVIYRRVAESRAQLSSQ